MSGKNLTRRGFLQGVTAGSTGAALLSLSSKSAAEAATTESSPVATENYPVAHSEQTGTLHILTLQTLIPENAEKIRRFSPRVEYEHVGSIEELNRRAADADAIFGRFNRETLQAAKKLKWIQYTSAGVERILYPELVNSSIVLTNMARMFAPGIAETAMGMLLALARRIDDYVRQTDQHKWGELDAVEIGGKTMGVVGFGGIGSTIAHHAHYGFGMRILAVDAKPLHKLPLVDELHEPEWLMDMVPQCDVLVSAAPHTPLTEKMFKEKIFRAMKRSAFFLNMSRGKLVDTPALVRALNEGWIAGAGIDVTHQEPLPAEEPLWSARNVIITSHSSGSSPKSRGRAEGLFLENVRRYVEGLPLLNVVDKKRGY